ncbi:hypothetical protein FHX37_1819 [Haloactinospora alba]|uniref:Uncharacterized protein n=1 Tax=Haloactinospora alba TaxID=405555 RepID=A0A543NJ99_9ACTN|nr:hypothetical protein [Haloactinospora alba]TQN31898.1 hypothetical protein FHX37_1819 [Haloactinospora alba]
MHAALAAQAGALLTDAMEPQSAGIRDLREHQRATGQAALDWLRDRLNHPGAP